MNRILPTITILALSAGFASAEVTLSGDARMGLLRDFYSDDIEFTSRVRVKFSLSGETDDGLAFGASFRADNAEAAAAGEAGSVWISGAFGKLSMGDLDGAAQAAVGQVSAISLTGHGDYHEMFYVGDAGGGGTDPSILYEYTTGSFTGYFSSQNPQVDGYRYAVGVRYATEMFSVAAGAESYDTPGNHIENYVIGATATLGAVTAKAIFGHAIYQTITDDNYALSLDYAVEALTVSAFYNYTDNYRYYGFGASYDLGGGASVVGGYSKGETPGETAYDLGLSFSF